MNIFEILLQKISFLHFNILLLFGFALVGGIVGSSFFKKLKIPQVVAFIFIGIVLGQSGIRVINDTLVSALEPFNYFALGLVGFMIGGEIKLSILRKYGKQFMYILLFEGLTAFAGVAILIFLISYYIFYDISLSIAIGLVLGSIASATAPAATTDVLWEYKTKGPLTTTVLGIVALDDALALLLFAFSSTIAMKVLGEDNAESPLLAVFHPIYEIGGSVLLGILGAFLLKQTVKKIKENDKILAFSIGTVLMVLGLSTSLKLDILLSSMSLGVFVVNIIPRKSEELFKLMSDFTPPIYIIFFVLVGAKLHLKNLTIIAVLFTIIYLFARTAGKMFGSYVGSRIAQMPKAVYKNLPLCLFSQAGVAIGLSIVASHIFNEALAEIIVAIITSSTFVVQLIGPIFTRIGVQRAGEINKNITEEDLLDILKAKDIIDINQTFIYETQSIKDVFSIFSNTNHLYYPVINKAKHPCGILTVDSIKQIILKSGLEGLVLAYDIMENYKTSVKPFDTLRKVIETMKSNDMEYALVVDDNNLTIGPVERRNLDRILSSKLDQHSIS